MFFHALALSLPFLRADCFIFLDFVISIYPAFVINFDLIETKESTAVSSVVRLIDSFFSRPEVDSVFKRTHKQKNFSSGKQMEIFEW